MLPDPFAEPFTPSPAVLRYLRNEAGLSQAALAAELGVYQPQITRWESSEYTPRRAPRDFRRRVPADKWERVENDLALGSDGKPPVYALAQYTPETGGMDWLQDAGGRVLVFAQGGLATIAADVLQALGYEGEAVPVAMDYLEGYVENGTDFVHVDKVAGDDDLLDTLAVRSLIAHYIANVIEGWNLRVRRNRAAEAARGTRG